MSDKKYRICLYVPLGKRDGTLSLHESDGRITGYMDILKQKSDIVRTLCSDGHLELCGVLGTLRKLCSALSVSADYVIKGTECSPCSEEINSILAPLSEAEKKAVKMLAAFTKILKDE